MSKRVDFGRASFEFLSIVVAVVLAMALTEWREDHLNRKLASQSLNNIIEEVQENRRELMNDSSQISKDISFINGWLESYSREEEQNNFSSNFSFSFLSKSALEVAKINNSLTYLPNEVNMEIAEVYATQEFYSDNAIKLFDIMGQMGRTDSKERMEAFVDQVRQMRFHLVLVRNTIKAYLGESEKFLESRGVKPASETTNP